MQRINGEWQASHIDNFNGMSYTCGYCNSFVCPPRKYVCLSEYYPKNEVAFVFVCTRCNRPTFISNSQEQVPRNKYGSEIQFLPNDIAQIYKEAKECYSVGAYTASSLLCRKILMNVSVSKGASEGKSFQFYVSFLDEKNYIPPDGKEWVDEIRKQGNEATHEIKGVIKQDSLEILDFTTMLLTFIYEMPGRMNNRKKQI